MLELSQKAARIYQNKAIEQKRLIMSEMFHSIVVSGDVVSVKLTKLAQIIAQKAQETNDKLDGSKDDEQETKNDLDNSGDEGHFDAENELCSSWLGAGTICEYFCHEANVDTCFGQNVSPVCCYKTEKALIRSQC